MTDNSSLTPAAPDHLYTWLDVDRYFAELAERQEWPSWLLEVDAYWDGVRLLVTADATEAGLWAWMRQILGPLTADPDRRRLLLDDAGTERPLPVEIETASGTVPLDRRPRWADRRVVASLAEPLPRPASDRLPGDVVVAVFHSFKGGVGRTLHCVAAAYELARAVGTVLLVDADLDAPGITWMVSDAIRIDFAFEDFLALVHGSTDDTYQEAVSLGTKFLRNQELHGVIVLPARRDFTRMLPPRIRPDDLLTPGRAPYVLTEVLARLGHAVGARAVLVDLRAGASELNAPLLLDPRAYRVVVSTTSDQAVRGTRHLLRQLARRAPATRPMDPDCTVLLTQFSAQDHEDIFAAAATELGAAAREVVRPAATEAADSYEESVDVDLADPILRSPFDPRLLSLPAEWEAVLGRAADAGLAEAVRPLVATIQSALSIPEPELPEGPSASLDQQRQSLADTADQLVYADVSEGSGFLVTDALRSLVEAHRTEMPIEVVLGGKGAGKTFTHLQLCQSRSWDGFARDAGIEGVRLTAPVVPVLASLSLAEGRRVMLDQVLATAAERLTGRAATARVSAIRELVQEHLRSDLDELGWRRVWLLCFARAAGLETDLMEVEDQLAEFARERQAVFVLDGLEDLFQEFTASDEQKRALRALLTGCPDWLRTLRGRPLGLVTFVRKDLAQAALPQNFGQFERRHQKYALRWNREEALRLAAWVCHRGGALTGPEGGIKKAGEEALSRRMLPIWGDKMGSPRSREARSESWFFAALSDFIGQIQARDIVAFLANAARESVGDTRWPDRVLAPAAMRKALGACSRQKIEAISEENRPVGQLLDRLKNVPYEQRSVPLRLNDVELSIDDAGLLVTNGILFREADQYWIPEIYRHGLNFRASGRPRVVNIANLVRRRNDPAS